MVNLKQLQNKLKETPKMITRAKKKTITTGTNSYPAQFLNTTFKRRRNSSGSLDQEYFNRRTTGT